MSSKSPCFSLFWFDHSDKFVIISSKSTSGEPSNDLDDTFNPLMPGGNKNVNKCNVANL